MLQWGRRNYPAETPFPGRDDGPYTLALQWGRRNYPAETTYFRGSAEAEPGRFNGAAGITRRKRSPKPAIPTAPSSLQWGRRNYPAETLPDGKNDPARILASMGPPELPGGNPYAAWLMVKIVPPLQWGRRNYPAETPARAAGAA